MQQVHVFVLRTPTERITFAAHTTITVSVHGDGTMVVNCGSAGVVDGVVEITGGVMDTTGSEHA